MSRSIMTSYIVVMKIVTRSIITGDVVMNNNITRYIGSSYIVHSVDDLLTVRYLPPVCRRMQRTSH